MAPVNSYFPWTLGPANHLPLREVTLPFSWHGSAGFRASFTGRVCPGCLPAPVPSLHLLLSPFLFTSFYREILCMLILMFTFYKWLSHLHSLHALSSCSSYHMHCPSPWMSSHQLNVNWSPLVFSKASFFLISILSEIPSFPPLIPPTKLAVTVGLYFSPQIQTHDLLLLPI